MFRTLESWNQRFFFGLNWNSTNSGFVTAENEIFPCKYQNSNDLVSQRKYAVYQNRRSERQ